MIRNLKALGLALVAVFALSAMAASAAQATGPEFWTGTGNTFEHGTVRATFDTGKQVFTSKPLGAKVRCDEVHGSATLAAPSNELTAENLAFTGNCLTASVFPTTVNTNGCHFTFTVENTHEGSKTVYDGKVHLVCPSGGPESITVTVFEAGTEPPHEGTPICTIHIPGGQTFGGITYHNIETAGGRMHVTVEAKTGAVIHSTYNGSLCEGKSSTEDSFEGSFIASAENKAGEPIDATITDTP